LRNSHERFDMGAQYFCKNLRRREAVRAHPGLNGIDYLEVLDHDAPQGSPPQQTLLVRCLEPVAVLTTDNVRIEGGVRIVPIGIEWVFPASAVPPATQIEQTFFASLPNPDHVLVVRTSQAGDFSTYSLRLLPPSDGLQFAFDPQLSAVDFSFKVECPSDFDCQSAEACQPEVFPEPLIGYMAKDYGSFRRLMLDRLAVTMPSWLERHPADIGVALVEVLAYAADRLSYYQDAVATEAYLGTARKRISVRRHARLLDYPMQDGCNARAWVFIEVDRGSGADGATILGPSAGQPGTVLLTRTGDNRTDLYGQPLDAALNAGAEVFETMHDLVLASAHNEMRFHTWSDEQCCLPKGAIRATLKNSSGSIHLGIRDVLVFEEKLGPGSGLPEDADPNHRHAVRLTSVAAAKDPLDGTDLIEIEWDTADALPFPLCISTVVTGLQGDVVTSDMSVARGNIVLADHGLSVSPEVIKPDGAPPLGRFRPRLNQTAITFRVPYDHSRTQSSSAVATIAQDPHAALPAVVLRDKDGAWTAQRDLLSSDPSARDFVVETEDDGSAYLRFGDDVLGKRPTSNLTASYRVGTGSSGNVGADSIGHILSGLNGIQAVRNPLPAQSGTDPESIERVRLYAPQAFRTEERAVTEADYATVAQRHPEVRKAQATLRWTGSWHTMFITVQRIGNRQVDDIFKRKLRDFLEFFRLAGYDVELEAPIFVPLDIAFTVCVAPGYFRTAVQSALLDVFGSRELSNGRRGFFHPDNFTFGQSVFLSQIVAAAMRVSGVAWVDTEDIPPKLNRFQRWGQARRGETAAGRIEFERLEIAQLDNDPNAPENGRIEFYMEGGL
jgi:hypothetical protein